LPEGATRDALHAIVPSMGICAVAPNGASLAQIIVQQENEKSIFFCGDQRRPELPRILADAGLI
jgi:hypothetical protein